jgi:hypothetical protein
MPVPLELKPFFTGLVEKSRKSEINWEANGGSDAYRVRFEDFAIGISQDQRTSTVRVQLLNDRGEPTAVINVEKGDDEWIGAVSLINTADLKVRKVGHTLGRAMEELGRAGLVGLDPERS